MAPPTVSDLVFSEQANHNFSKILGDLKRANLSVTNRLQSIRQDAQFVQQVAVAYGLPLVANERCGSWYIDPELKAASAYFKSTDGHMGQWSFSTRRLNLHLLELIERNKGCIIVDSTRRGKRMPDALSKTVPIWCCVLNRALFPDQPDSHGLYVPPHVVSDSERSQMEARLPEFLRSLEQLGIDLPGLRSRLTKVLRPIWRTRDDPLPDPSERGSFAAFHPVVCCTSSRRVAGAEMSEAGYIQGAGDDTENWAHGLTAPLFWERADDLLATPEADIPGLIAELVAGAARREPGEAEAPRRLTPRISVSPLPIGPGAPGPGGCRISIVSASTEPEAWAKSKTDMEVGIGRRKVASRNLRHALPAMCEFASGCLRAAAGPEGGRPPQILVACESGRDVSVGAALAIDCWCFGDDGAMRPEGGEQHVEFTKNLIRARLGRIMTAMPDANPSRATLQSVNSFLMDWRR